MCIIGGFSRMVNNFWLRLPLFIGGSAKWPPEKERLFDVHFAQSGTTFVAVPAKEAMRLAFMRSICYSMEFTKHRGKYCYPDMLLLETGDEAALPMTSVLNDLPNLMMPPVTDVPRTILALRWLVAEMNRRKRAMDSAGALTSGAFNALLDVGSNDQMLNLCAVVSDYGALMRRARMDAEPLLRKLCKTAALTGIHLFCFITEEDWADESIVHRKIKESVAVMHVTDAENLTAELEKDIALRFHEMGEPPNYNKKLLKKLFPEEVKAAVSPSPKKSEPEKTPYERAVEVVRATNRASVAHLQRQMCIGYNQAVDLIDELEKHGVIGPKRPGWPTREVLVKAANSVRRERRQHGTRTGPIPAK